ncbi:hypothetical protein PRtIB026_A23270 [Pseudomonas sp. RtIB026]|uniref:hypothetical protein n=1 Tax=Pseudomonas sp. RtIB026 TaxID=2749999 RepID=UPI001942CA32|nr:hypothetical protein [Pseudomonas sp. RtIB026]BCJ07986.1 hypothetical protein PRtIB026_A23270 [Pseudomonas sp. RtIB026]
MNDGFELNCPVIPDGFDVSDEVKMLLLDVSASVAHDADAKGVKGFALKQLVKAIWRIATPNDPKVELYESMLCRAVGRVEQEIVDYLKNHLTNEIEVYRVKFEIIDILIEEGNIESARGHYISTSSQMVGMEQKFKFTDVLTKAYTSGFYSAWVQMSSSFWLNTYYNDILKLSPDFIEGQYVLARSILLDAAEYIEGIEEEVHTIFSASDCINDLQTLRMWVGLASREAVNIAIDALNLTSPSHAIETKDIPVAYIHEPLGYNWKLNDLNDKENYCVSSLLRPNSQLSECLCPVKNGFDVDVGAFAKISWEGMKDIGNPAVYNMLRYTGKVSQTGYPPEANPDNKINGEFALDQRDIIGVDHMATSSPANSIFFILSDGTVVRPNSQSTLVKSFQREGYYIVGFEGYTDGSQTALMNFAVTYLRIDGPTKYPSHTPYVPPKNNKGITFYSEPDYQGAQLQVDTPKSGDYAVDNFPTRSYKTTGPDNSSDDEWELFSDDPDKLVEFEGDKSVSNVDMKIYKVNYFDWSAQGSNPKGKRRPGKKGG